MMSDPSLLVRSGGGGDPRSFLTVSQTLRQRPSFQWPVITSRHQICNSRLSHHSVTLLPPRLSCQPWHREDLTLQQLLLFKHWPDRLLLQTLLQPVLLLLCPVFPQLPGRAERERWMREPCHPHKKGSSDQEKFLKINK